MKLMILRATVCIIIIIVFISTLHLQRHKFTIEEIVSKQTTNAFLENNFWEREMSLDQDGRITIQWNFTKEEITMLVIGRTTGFVGIGFTHSAGMADSDIIIGWVKDGLVHIRDFYGVKNGIPVEDPHQDYNLLFGGENETHTWFCFNRKLDTKDKHDIKITMSTFNILWAINQKDVLDSGLTDFDYHRKNRGMEKALLLYISTRKPPMTADIETFDIRMDNRKVVQLAYKMPYSYLCKLIKVPNFGEMHHLIGFEVLFNYLSRKIIHHLLLYHCEEGVAGQSETKNKRNSQCSEEITSFVLCKKPIAGIAVSQRFSFTPAHLGIPFGSFDDKDMYLLMEIHYDLGNKSSTFIDNSGLRLFHTRKLRPFSIGPMAMMSRLFYVIPPNADDFPIYAVASSACTKSLFPKEGIHIAAVYMHSHKYIERLTLYHYRNNIEINRISEEHFDYNFQRPRWLKDEILVLQGDIIIYECLHNTSDRDTPMYSFMGAEDDMCTLMTLIYPNIPHSIFMTGLIPSELHKFFKEIPDLNIGNNSWTSFGLETIHSVGSSLYGFYHNWTKKEIEVYRELYKHGQYSTDCRFDTFNKAIIHDHFKLPNITSLTTP